MSSSKNNQGPLKKPLKSKRVDDQSGQGGGLTEDQDSAEKANYSSALPVTVVAAAWAKANDKPAAYAPMDKADEVNRLASVAQALNYEMGLGMSVSPSPFGTFKADDYGPKVTRDDVKKNPNDSVKTTRYEDGTKEVALTANYGHSYLVKGSIEGKEVTFLVDTGASNVSIPWRLANFIGLDKKKGRESSARTANGLVKTYEVVIDSLKIGDIELNFVGASVNQGDTSEEVLLGMSALKKLEFAYSDEKLYLRQRPKKEDPNRRYR